ncbi:MAG: SpoIIE family protein phosphatase [Chthoniobacteraceae bacterium]
MWISIIAALLALSWAVFFGFALYWRRRFLELDKAREDVVVEETRVFDFLHGLGAAFHRDLRTEDLHRLIVEGAMNILDAQGGALYLVERNTKTLIARHVSKGCPPLLEIPAHLENQPQAVQNYIRMHSITPGEGLIGTAWQNHEPELIYGPDPRLATLGNEANRPTSALLCPLIYGDQNLGVLAVANGPVAPEFSLSDVPVFKAIAEQSAFALYNAIIYFEASEKRRMDSDLQVAQDIQRILLPSSAPDFEGFEISGINLPGQVSGDYFDYLPIDECQLGVAIADVSGKGVPASLIMAMCRSVLRSHAPMNYSAAGVLKLVNRQLYPDIKEDMFISMAYLILNNITGQITLCRAGHDAPLLYSAKTGTVSKLNPPGMALGIDSGSVFDRIACDFSVTLDIDDCLVLYTDGVTEALDKEGMEFGMANMIDSIKQSVSSGASGIIERVTDDVLNFIGNTPRSDDITMIVIRRR